jgi:hypothetical protein
VPTPHEPATTGTPSREGAGGHDMTPENQDRAPGPVSGALRARARLLSPQDVRRIGIWLNGGRVRGWTEHVGTLMDVPAGTVRSWATPPTSSAARSISGPAANLLLAYVVVQKRGVPPESLAAAIEDEYRAGWNHDRGQEEEPYADP